MRLLVVKTTSLGDILNTLPAITDAARARPGLEIDWVAERPFAAAPAWHGAVRKVIPVDLRGWRRRFSAGDILAFLGQLRGRRYDLIIDAQGLGKSALIALIARGPVCGFDYPSAREGMVSIFYGQRAGASWDLHAVERQRRLFAQALSYDLPETPPDFGLARPEPPQRPTILLLHGTTWASKRWPEVYWIELAQRASTAGLEPILRWHDEEERKEADRIAAAVPGARVVPARDLESLRGVIGSASVAVANDSGPAHLAAALGIPSVTLYGATRPEHNGTIGPGQVHLSAVFPCSPCRARVCLYRGPSQVTPACYRTLPPARVWEEVKRLIS